MRPTRGVLSAVARVRSSAGRSPARPAATRSATAIWAATSSRSWPATGTPRPFSARITSSKAGPRLRTRISTSPGRQTRPVASPWLVQVRTACATRRAVTIAGALVSGRVHRGRPGIRLRPSAPARRWARARPRRGRRAARWRGRCRRTASSNDRPSLVRVERRRPRRPRADTSLVERNDRVERHVLEGQPGRARFADPGGPRQREFPRLGALEAVDRLLRDRPPRSACGCRSRAPSPAANSCGDARAGSPIARGLVSCASSISTWSMPRSSLYRTQPAPTRPSRSRALWIRSSKSRAPSRAFWASTRRWISAASVNRAWVRAWARAARRRSDSGSSRSRSRDQDLLHAGRNALVPRLPSAFGSSFWVKKTAR